MAFPLSSLYFLAHLHLCCSHVQKYRVTSSFHVPNVACATCFALCA